ncbi:MAG: hypothetical protein ABMA64_06540 [Myxococcota bacterium]
MAEQARVLREMGDEAGAAALVPTRHRGPDRGWYTPRVKLWQHSTHRLGFIRLPTDPDRKSVPIVAAGRTEPDLTLRGQRIDIKLDRLRVAEYPGAGPHHVLVTFDAVHGADEDLTFNQAYRVPAGDEAGVVGFPVFRGLVVPNGGVALQIATTNVKSSMDEDILGFLGSGAVAAGLQLLTTAQPALKPLVEVGRGLAKSIATRSQNVKVQELSIGLDFDDATLGPRLRTGNYIAAQSDDDINWSEWTYDRERDSIAHVSSGERLPYNYLVFRISRSS